MFLICFLEKEIPNHIEEIIKYDGVCKEIAIQVEEPTPKQRLTLEKTSHKHSNEERAIKRRREANEEDDYEDLRSKIERINHHQKLERELRDLQNEWLLQRVIIMERRQNSHDKAMKEKDQEIQALKRSQQNMQKVSFAPTAPTTPTTPKRKRVAAPRSRKNTVTTATTTTATPTKMFLKRSIISTNYLSVSLLLILPLFKSPG